MSFRCPSCDRSDECENQTCSNAGEGGRCGRCSRCGLTFHNHYDRRGPAIRRTLRKRRGGG